MKNERCMMKHFKKILLMLLAMPALFACINDDDVVATYACKTVIVYMVADNSLSGYVEANIDSMAAGMKKCKTKSNLLIYVDESNNIPQLIRIVIDADGTVKKYVIKNYEEQNSVSPTVMASVISEVANSFPSQSYGLVLWSHGYGWLPGGGNTKTISTRWFGQDDSNYMDIPDLVTALNAGPHFDYILFDACFMGGVETDYALKNNAGYIIASPAEVMAAGFPYRELMPSLLGTTEADYIKAATLYYEYYNALSATDSSSSSAAVGCIKTSELSELANQTAALITAHAKELNTFDASKVQPLEAKSPHLFYDFGDFIRLFTTDNERTAFNEQLEKCVVYKACTPKILSAPSFIKHFITISSFSGLNTYIPRSELTIQNTAYRSTGWYAAVGWNKTQW
jgi:hypothetical protein